MDPLTIGLISQIPKLLGGFFGGGKQKRLAKKINPVDPTYQVSKSSQDELALSQNAFNARMPGASNAEQNILTGEANQLAGVNRNATDSSQALAVAAGVGGQTNQSLIDLGTAEGNNKNSRQGMYMQALQNMSQEEKLVFQDQLRKYQEALKAKQDLMRSGMANQQNAFNEVGNLGALYASGLFGNNQGTAGAGAGAQGGQSAEDILTTYNNRRPGIMMPRLRF